MAVAGIALKKAAPSPLYKPDTPSSFTIMRAQLIIPVYFCCTVCKASLVRIRSSGKVPTHAVAPAHPPAMSLTGVERVSPVENS